MLSKEVTIQNQPKLATERIILYFSTHRRKQVIWQKQLKKLIIQSCRWKEKASTRPSVHKLNWLILELEALERENFDARYGDCYFIK